MNSNFRFVSLLEGDKPVNCSSFKEAFAVMYQWVTAKLKTGLSYQALETAIWIETEKGPLFFYDARDKAIADEILVDGKLV
jgi:hypothetical protein